MKLRVKVSPRSGERDQVFTHTYDGVRYTVGPEPVEVPEEAGKYLATSFSDSLEVVSEPVPGRVKLVDDELGDKPAKKPRKAKKVKGKR